MTDSLTLTAVAYAAALATWSAVSGVRGRVLSRGQLASTLVLEAALVGGAALRLGGWALSAGARPTRPAIALGYVLATVVVLPLAAGIPRSSATEPSDASAFAVAIGCAAAAVASLRLRATWGS